MIMGFVLPFALAFVAIPLESTVYSLRTVIGVLLVQTLRGLGFLIRFTGVLFKRFAKVLELVYDIPIVIPVMIEGWVVASRSNPSEGTIAVEDSIQTTSDDTQSKPERIQAKKRSAS